jgi:hypothetical protein
MPVSLSVSLSVWMPVCLSVWSVLAVLNPDND